MYPSTEFPYLQKIYGFYGKTNLTENAHFADEGHDYGYFKTKSDVRICSKNFNLNINAI